MYFLLCLIAAVAYGLQNTLMASVYRKMDGLSAVAYRGLSLGLTMLPLLFFVPLQDFQSFHSQVPLVALAALSAASGNWAAAKAYVYLPIGVTAALGMSFSAIFASGIAFVLLNEILTSWQLLVGAALLFSILLLGWSSSSAIEQSQFEPKKGVLYCLLFGFLIASGFILVGIASRELHPFLIGYAWEFSIGVFAMLGATLRKPLFKKPGFSRLSGSEFREILIYSSPTAIGTGLYSLAMTMGSIGLAAAIVSSMMIFSALFAQLFYAEKLNKLQWSLLSISCCLLFLLKIVSD